MAHILWFGKFKGHSLEEIALGKKFKGLKMDEGYHYFINLAQGDKTYFGAFQNSPQAMARWRVIHNKLNEFESVYPCAVCKSTYPTQVSIAGDRRWGHSMGSSYICCDSDDCQKSLAVKTNGVFFYPLGFDTILKFGWGSGGTKFDENEVLELMRDLAGWKKRKRITAESATEFIDGLKIRGSN